MRRHRAHLALAAWHTMILSQYFFLFISVCFIKQCQYNVITFFHYLCKQGYSAAFWWNCTNVRMQPAYMQSARCQVKITNTNPAPSKHWHPPPSVGCVALTVDGSFSGANPLTKYQQLRLKKILVAYIGSFLGVYSFLKEAPIYFSLFVHSVTTLTQRSRAILG